PQRALRVFREPRQVERAHRAYARGLRGRGDAEQDDREHDEREHAERHHGVLEHLQDLELLAVHARVVDREDQQREHRKGPEPRIAALGYLAHAFLRARLRQPAHLGRRTFLLGHALRGDIALGSAELLRLFLVLRGRRLRQGAGCLRLLGRRRGGHARYGRRRRRRLPRRRRDRKSTRLNQSLTNIVCRLLLEINQHLTAL